MNVYIQYIFIAFVVGFAIVYVGRMVYKAFKKDKKCGDDQCGCGKS